MIDLQIDDSALARQITALEAFEPTVSEEFSKAGERTAKLVQRDLRRGVGRVTGDLATSIMGEIKPLAGVETDLVMGAHAAHAGYEYGARLDKDGRMTWRSGPFAGRRTFGWFSYVLLRLGPRMFKRAYQLALDKAVRKLVVS